MYVQPEGEGAVPHPDRPRWITGTLFGFPQKEKIIRKTDKDKNEQNKLKKSVKKMQV